ncbi:PREDICTED: uncharacterized protein LOC109150717 [Ipomoea nil]|uniref:uncharacterized protein LOC109150717 n=1 Tax=Ipomoea nil TaxID=35883 RepID=UPI00090176F6|nr:PREDICTED: uncharacterized protein LOC109150717 [Ipomoea nil]
MKHSSCPCSDADNQVTLIQPLAAVRGPCKRFSRVISRAEPESSSSLLTAASLSCHHRRNLPLPPHQRAWHHHHASSLLLEVSYTPSTNASHRQKGEKTTGTAGGSQGVVIRVEFPISVKVLDLSIDFPSTIKKHCRAQIRSGRLQVSRGNISESRSRLIGIRVSRSFPIAPLASFAEPIAVISPDRRVYPGAG